MRFGGRGRRGVLAADAALSAQEYKIGKADIKLGVASYSFRKFPRAQAIQMTKQLGTPYINIKSFHLPTRTARRSRSIRRAKNSKTRG